MKMKLALLVLSTSVLACAQPWSTFLDSSRALDWSNTNIGFTIPNYTVNCATQPTLVANDVAMGPANTTAIQAALASCDATHNVVNIPAGTYYVAGVTYGAQGAQVIRGAGTMATTIIMSGQAPCGHLLGFCMTTSNPVSNGTPSIMPGGSNACNWTAAGPTAGQFQHGATSITLDTCGSAPVLNQLMVLDQANDLTDTGGVMIADPSVDFVNMQPRTTSVPNCAAPNNNLCAGGFTIGFYIQGNVNHNGRTIPANTGVTHSQQQVVLVTAVTGSGSGPYTVTISPGVAFNNIRTSQSPGAWWPGNLVRNDGIEDLTIIHGVSRVLPQGTGNTAGFVPGNYLLGVTSGSTAYIAKIDAPSNSIFFAGQQGGLFMTGETIDQTTTRGGVPTGVSMVNSSPAPGQAAGSTGVEFYWCYQCWERNVRSEYAGGSHAFMSYSYGCVIRDSYFYNSQLHSTQSYVLELVAASNALLENNIIQQNTNSFMFGQASNSYVGYNYANYVGFQNADGSPNAFFIDADAGHNAGNGMNLWEGNNFGAIWSDIYWGPSSTTTLFRNMMRGWQIGKLYSTTPFRVGSKIRVFNLVGNVMGQPLYHKHYESYATSTTDGINGGPTGGGDAAGNLSLISLGWSGNTQTTGCLFPPACDPLVHSTLMRWGNWTSIGPGDTAAQVTWDPTEASPAAVPFANANFTSAYFTTLAHTLPASLYYTARPSWWPAAKAWPPTGPDVTNGNLGLCTGGTYDGAQATAASQCTGGTFAVAYAGHATSIPAHDCYLNVMGGPPDGSGGPLNFDANVCYYGAVSTGPVITSTSPLPAGTVNAAYSYQFAASGATPITWAATGLPAGLTFSTITPGLLSGTPTAVGTSTINVTATNSGGSTGPALFSITINSATVPTTHNTGIITAGVVTR